jgi:hypothetical protein
MTQNPQKLPAGLGAFPDQLTETLNCGVNLIGPRMSEAQAYEIAVSA